MKQPWFMLLLVGLLAGLLIPIDLIAAGQATGKRTHKPIKLTIYYDSCASAIDAAGSGTIVAVGGESGTYVVGTVALSGAITWSSPRASGIEAATGAAIGFLRSSDRPALAITAPSANRANIFELTSGASAAPVPVYLPALGPSAVVAVDIGGTGNTALDDLFVASEWNGSTPDRFTAMRNRDGATFTSIEDRPVVGRLLRANPFRPQAGEPEAVGVWQQGTAGAFVVYRLDSGRPVEVLRVPGLPMEADWDWGYFGSAASAQIIVAQRGATNASAAVLGPGAAPPNLAVTRYGVCLQTARPLGAVFVVGTPLGDRLLVIDDDGAGATVYLYSGTGLATVGESFQPPAGERFGGAVALGTNGFVLFGSGAGASVSSSLRHHVYRPQVSGQSVTHVLASSGVLPRPTLNSGRANVFQYQREPFVNGAPNLLRSLNAGDWSSQFSLAGGPPTISVQTETYLDPLRGLDDPTPSSLGPAHPLAQFGSVNQYRDDISLSVMSVPAGDEISEVTIQPPAGRYGRAVRVALTAADPAHRIYYRLNRTGPWVSYGGAPFVLFGETTVDYYGEPPGGSARSRVRTARYQFTVEPGELDSDGDGVPDFVEAARALDPTAGADQDADGFADKQELLEGTSPTDPGSRPAGTPGYEQHAAVDLAVAVRPWDGVVEAETSAAVGTVVRLYDLSGNLLGTEVVTNVPGLPAATAAVFRRVPVEARQPILIVDTAPHFDVVTAGADRRIGRELAGLVSLEPLPAVTVPYVYGGAGGSPAAEADAWVAAARLAQQNSTAMSQEWTLTFESIQRLALFERVLLYHLAQRGFTEATNGTLLPFRSADAGRNPVPSGVWLAAEASDRANPTRPVLRRADLAAAILERSQQGPAAAFRDLARELYALSSRSNNVSPGVYRQPLDMLRGFVASVPGEPAQMQVQDSTAKGVIQQLGRVSLEEAVTAVDYILQGLRPRAVTNLLLRVRADSFDGLCPVFETTSGPPTWVNLLSPDGGPFEWADATAPVTGTVLEVTGYADVSVAACPGPAIEVIVARIVSVPVEAAGDADGNLLPDAWEALFFGRTGMDPLGDLDLDGYANLQELAEGSDPRDGLGSPGVPVENLAPPKVEATLGPAGSLVLEWTWPERYAPLLSFSVQSAAELGQPFSAFPVTPVHLGHGRYRADLGAAAGGAAQRYFVVGLRLGSAAR